MYLFRTRKRNVKIESEMKYIYKPRKRSNAFEDWVVTFCLMDCDKEEGFIKTKNKVTEGEFSVEQEYKPLDWKQALNALVSRAAKDIEKMGDKSEVSKEQYQALLAMTSE